MPISVEDKNMLGPMQKNPVACLFIAGLFASQLTACPGIPVCTLPGEMPEAYADDYEYDDDINSAKSISYDEMQYRSLHTGTDLDVIAFQGSAYQMITLDIAYTDGYADPVLELYDDRGVLLAYNDDYYDLAPRIIQQLPKDGTYYAVVYPYDHNAWGWYDIQLLRGDCVDEYASQVLCHGQFPDDFTPTQPPSDDITPTPTPYDMSTPTPAAPSPTPPPYDPDPTPTAAQDDEPGDWSALDDYEPDNMASRASTIKLDRTQYRGFHSAGDVDYVQVFSEDGGTYQVQLRPGDNRIDAVVTVFSEEMEILDEVDMAGVGGTESVDLHLMGQSAVYLRISPYNQETLGLYSLRLIAR